MSDVEQYWEAIRKKWKTPLPEWKDLGMQRQQMVIHSINIMLQVLYEQV